jgi:AraC family transcriptional regulator
MLVETARQDGPGQSLLANPLSEAIAVEMLRGHAKTSRHTGAALDPRIAKAVAHVEAAYAEPLGVDDLARTAGMSRFHFSRLFKAQMGTSPHQFITQHRVAHAARLLRAGRYNVTEAAMSVGMSELGRFSQVFRRQIGCSPSDFYRSFR